jgi:hypothetical protein
MREKLDGDGETLGWRIWWERCTIWKQCYCGQSHCRLKWTYCVSEIKLSLWSKNKQRETKASFRISHMQPDKKQYSFDGSLLNNNQRAWIEKGMGIIQWQKKSRDLQSHKWNTFISPQREGWGPKPVTCQVAKQFVYVPSAKWSKYALCFVFSCLNKASSYMITIIVRKRKIEKSK